MITPMAWSITAREFYASQVLPRLRQA